MGPPDRKEDPKVITLEVLAGQPFWDGEFTRPELKGWNGEKFGIIPSETTILIRGCGSKYSWQNFGSRPVDP